MADWGTLAVDAKLGREVWSSKHSGVAYGPTIVRAVVYSGDNANKIVEFDLETGKQVGGGAVSGLPGTPAFADRKLLVADLSGVLTAYSTDAATPSGATAFGTPMPSGSTPLPPAAGIQSTFLRAAKFGSIANLAFALDGTI